MATATPSESVHGGLEARVERRRGIPLEVQLSCAPGELHVIVGPSGSGKTTLLRAIAGTVAVDQGYIACGDAVWLDTARAVALAPQARRVGLVFQHYALMPHLTARQNVELALLSHPEAERRRRALDWLQRVHMEGLAERRPTQLSGGQQQRVAVARALARAMDDGPSVLLLDEPFSAVDQVTRTKLQRELALLRRELSVPILLVTHDLEEGHLLGDRMTVLHRGRNLQTDRPEILLTRPRSVAVARHVALTNLFEGVITGTAETEHGLARLQIDWHGVPLEAELRSPWLPGTRIAWVIPPQFIVLHRPDRPTRGDAENPVRVRLTEVLALGGVTSVTAVPVHAPDQPLSFAIPTHAARRSELAAGASATLSLLAEGIHLLPGEPAGGT